MTSHNKCILALVAVAITGSSIMTPVGAKAQSASDLLGSIGLGLGAGGNCDTDESTENGPVINADSSTKTPYNAKIGKTDCSGSRDLIKHITNGALKNEQRLIQSNHTLGMINSIGSIAAPIFGALASSSQARAQAPDNSQYLQVIQQQQQQIDELRQMMAQRQNQFSDEGYVRVHARSQQAYEAPLVYSRQRTRPASSSLRQTNLF